MKPDGQFQNDLGATLIWQASAHEACDACEGSAASVGSGQVQHATIRIAGYAKPHCLPDEVAALVTWLS